MKEAAAEHLTGDQGLRPGALEEQSSARPRPGPPQPRPPPAPGSRLLLSKKEWGDGGVGGGLVDVKGATEGCVEIKVYSRHYGVQIIYAPQVESNAITRNYA